MRIGVLPCLYVFEISFWLFLFCLFVLSYSGTSVFISPYLLILLFQIPVGILMRERLWIWVGGKVVEDLRRTGGTYLRMFCMNRRI